MKNSVTKFYVVSVLLLVFIAVALLGRSSFSQSSDNQSSGAGRYQVVAYNTGTAPNIILLDTQTGRIWIKDNTYSPATKKWDYKWQEDGPFLSKSASK
jgi:hypothetical protein